ncbi:MAG: preprotein translocase subunit SecE [Christensenellaceae bacterium]|jgi:preprotein translocase subunit SecE|nr:preprotein translocase subunit SecE [Christensenellaceae bacterium]
MSSKSKRKHANKNINRQNTGGNLKKAATPALLNDKSLSPGEVTAPVILSPKELRQKQLDEKRSAQTALKEKRKLEKEKKKEEKTKNPKKKPFAWIGEMIGELKKVHWPSWSQTVKATAVVFAVVSVFAIVILGIDYVMKLLYDLLIQPTANVNSNMSSVIANLIHSIKGGK